MTDTRNIKETITYLDQVASNKPDDLLRQLADWLRELVMLRQLEDDGK